MKQNLLKRTLLAIAAVFLMTTTAMATGFPYSGSLVATGHGTANTPFATTVVQDEINSHTVRLETTFTASAPTATRQFALFLQLANAAGDPIQASLTMSSRIETINVINRFGFGVGARTGSNPFMQTGDAFMNLFTGSTVATDEFGMGVSINNQLRSPQNAGVSNNIVIYASISGTTLTARVYTNGTAVPSPAANAGTGNVFEFTVPDGSQIGSFHAWMNGDGVLTIPEWRITDDAHGTPNLGTGALFTALGVNSLPLTIPAPVSNNAEISFEMPAGTDLSAVNMAFTTSRNAVVTIPPSTAPVTSPLNNHDFSSPVTFRVESGDEDTYTTYQITLNIGGLSDEAELSSFFANFEGITPNAAGMAQELPYGTDLSAVIVRFATTCEYAVVTVDNQVNPIANFATVDFTGGTRTFTVTAQDEVTTETYAVTLTVGTLDADQPMLLALVDFSPAGLTFNPATANNDGGTLPGVVTNAIAVAPANTAFPGIATSSWTLSERHTGTAGSWSFASTAALGRGIQLNTDNANTRSIDWDFDLPQGNYRIVVSGRNTAATGNVNNQLVYIGDTPLTQDVRVSAPANTFEFTNVYGEVSVHVRRGVAATLSNEVISIRVYAIPTPSFTVTFNATPANGTVEVVTYPDLDPVTTGDEFESGTQLRFTATPASADFIFQQWTGGYTENPRTITLTRDTTINATFIDAPTQEYVVTINQTSGGTVAVTHGDNVTVATGDEVLENTILHLTATPDNGYRFVEWMDGNETNPRNLELTSAVTIYATFEQIPDLVLIAQFDSRPIMAATGVNTGNNNNWSQNLIGGIFNGLDFNTAVPTGNNAIRWRSAESEQLDANGGNRVTTSVQSFQGPIRVVMSVRSANSNNHNNAIAAGELTMTHGTNVQTTEAFGGDADQPWVERVFEFDHTFNGPISFNWPWGGDNADPPGRMRLREVRVYGTPSGPQPAEFARFTVNGELISPTTAGISHALPYGTDLTEVEVTFVQSLGAVVDISGTEITSPTTRDFTTPITFNVTCRNDDVTNSFPIELTETPASNLAVLTSLTVGGEVIDPIEPVMATEVPFGTPLNEVSVAFVVSEFATVTVADPTERVITSGANVNFTNSPVLFTVTAQDQIVYNEFNVSVTVDQDIDFPLYWHTGAGIPSWITYSKTDLPEFANFGRRMLVEEDDYFIVDFAGYDSEYRTLVSTEFRWDARSNAVVVVEESADGTDWTEVNRVANNAGGSPGSGACIDLVAGQEGATLISMNAPYTEMFARFQSLLSPEARFVRYRVVQNDDDEAYFVVQAITIQDFTHDIVDTVLFTDFAGLNTTTDVQEIAGGTVRTFNANVINNPGTAAADRHPCPTLWSSVNPVARINNNPGIEFSPTEPIRHPGVVVMNVASHTNTFGNVRLQYSVDGSNWVLFSDTAWVMAQGTMQTMYFEFPQVIQGIRYFRASRGPITGQTGGRPGGDITWFMFDFAVHVTAPPADPLGLATVTFDEETLYFEPWQFIVANDPAMNIVRGDVEVALVDAEHAEVTAYAGFPVTAASFTNDTATVTFTVTETGGTDYSVHTVMFIRDTERPAIIAYSPDGPSGVGLPASGTITLTWNKPIQRLESNTGNVMIGAIDVTSRIIVEGDELRIPFTAEDWYENEMSIVVAANAVQDFFMNTNEATAPIIYTRDLVAPRIVQTFPREGSTTAPMAGGIMLTLSEQFTTGNIDASQFILNDEPLISGTNIFFWGGDDNRTIFIPYRELAANKQYTLVVPASQIRDVAGNYMTEDFTLTFTTGGMLRLAQGEDFVSDTTYVSGHEFAVPSWITTRVGFTTPTGPAMAWRMIGYDPTYYEAHANLDDIWPGTAGQPETWDPERGGAYRIQDTLVFHFDAIGDLSVWINASGGRAAAMWTECNPADRRISPAFPTRWRDAWTETFDISYPVRILLAVYGNVPAAETGGATSTGNLVKFAATYAPLNPVAVFEAFAANERPIAVPASAPFAMTHGLPHDASLTDVEVTFTASHNAVVRIGDEVVTSPHTMTFVSNEPVTFAITAEDGVATTTYTVALNITDRPTFTEFMVLGQDATIGDGVVTHTLAEGTSLTTVGTLVEVNVPSVVTVGGIPVAQGTVHSQNFTSPVEYVITADTGGVAITYIVTVRAGDPASIGDLVMEVVSFYPNPVVDVLNITTNTNIRTIEIVNMMGTIVISTSGSGNSHALDVSNLSPGLHFVRVTTDTGVSVGRFIKQ